MLRKYNDFVNYYLLLFYSFFFVCFLFAPTTGTAEEITVGATLTPSSISINESAQLALHVNGTKSAEIELPEVKGLDILRRGQSSRINIINGSYSSSLTTTYDIIASAPGQYTIPPIKVTAGKQHLETESLELTVARTPTAGNPGSGTAQHPAADENPRFFMTLENLDREYYLGEVVPVKIKAYFQQGLRADLASLPRLLGDSCVIEPLKKDPAQIRETINGTNYNVLTWETDLSPIKEGEHTLKLEMDAVQYIQQRRQSTSMFGSQSPFGRDLFDDFFGGVQKRPFKTASEPLQVTIHPLPAEGRPENFNGAVGQFSFQTAVKPDSAEVGEPLTLQLQIRGAGNIDRVEAPRFPEPPEWKSYPPSVLESSPQHRGERIFEQAIVAKSREVKEVPEISFSYFDPDRKTYITLTSPPLPVTISGENTSLPAVQPVVTPTREAPVKDDDLDRLAPLHLEQGRPVSMIRPLFLHNWFILLLGTIFLVLAGSAAARLHLHRLNKSRNQSHHVRLKNLRQSLQLMETAAGNCDSSAFLAEARNCIQQYFGSLWDCEPSAITLANISTRAAMSAQLVEFFRMSEQAAYGGKVLDKAAMADSLHLLRSELEESV